MQQTPIHTKANIDPLLFSPIVYETPRVMKFYRQHKNTIEKTPNQKKNIIRVYAPRVRIRACV